MLRETYMNIKDFMLPRNSGTPPDKLLFDKSLVLATESMVTIVYPIYPYPYNNNISPLINN